MNRCLARLGALPKKLVWEREGAIAPRGRPSEPFLAFCGSLAVGWIVLDAGDAQAKGALERDHRFVHGNFEAGRLFADPLDFQAQLDRWTDKINARRHRTTRALVAERLASERERMRALPAALPDSDRRWVARVAPQPYLRFDRNDYSLDPRLVGRRVEVRASQAQITALSLDTGELAARHRRVFAGGLTFTDPAHQAALEQLRGERRRGREPEVETRPLAGEPGSVSGRPGLLVTYLRDALERRLLSDRKLVAPSARASPTVRAGLLDGLASAFGAHRSGLRVSPQPLPRRIARQLCVAGTEFAVGSDRENA